MLNSQFRFAARLSSRRVIAPVMLVALCIGASVNTRAEPTADEVIQKFVEVTGGRDAYAKLKTRVSTGTIDMEQQDIRGPITLYQKAPNQLRMTGEIGTIKFERGFDGYVGYELNSMQGARIMEGEERDLIEQQALINPLNDLARFFTNIENVGNDPIDDHDAWKIEFTLKNGEKFTQWYDVETGLLLQMFMTMESLMGKLEIMISMNDWRDVSGIRMPFKIKQSIQPIGIEQAIEFTKVETNIEIPDEKLALPEDVAELLKDTGATQPATQPAGERR